MKNRNYFILGIILSLNFYTFPTNYVLADCIPTNDFCQCNDGQDIDFCGNCCSEIFWCDNECQCYPDRLPSYAYGIPPCTRDETCCSNHCNTFGECGCRVVNEACLFDSDCCDAESCNGGVCGGCKDTQEQCSDNLECCSGICKDNECITCVGTGSYCEDDIDCCDADCVNNQCEDCIPIGGECIFGGCCSGYCRTTYGPGYKGICTSCKSIGSFCEDSYECCSGLCTFDGGSFKCVDCLPSGSSCVSGDICCGGVCEGSICVLENCNYNGDPCITNEECCSSECDKDAGDPYGICRSSGSTTTTIPGVSCPGGQSLVAYSKYECNIIQCPGCSKPDNCLCESLCCCSGLTCGTISLATCVSYNPISQASGDWSRCGGVSSTTTTTIAGLPCNPPCECHDDSSDQYWVGTTRYVKQIGNYDCRLSWYTCFCPEGFIPTTTTTTTTITTSTSSTSTIAPTTTTTPPGGCTDDRDCACYEDCRVGVCVDIRSETGGCNYYDGCDGTTENCDDPDLCFLNSDPAILEECQDPLRYCNVLVTCP